MFFLILKLTDEGGRRRRFRGGDVLVREHRLDGVVQSHFECHVEVLVAQELDDVNCLESGG